MSTLHWIFDVLGLALVIAGGWAVIPNAPRVRKWRGALRAGKVHDGMTTADLVAIERQGKRARRFLFVGEGLCIVGNSGDTCIRPLFDVMR